LRAAAHPSHLQVPGELGAEAPDRHDDAECDKRDPGDGDDDAAVQGQHARGVIPRGSVTGSRPGAVHDGHQGADERDGIADASDQCPDPVALGQVQPPHRGLEKPPHGHSGEPDDQDPQQQVPERLAAIASMAPARSGSWRATPKAMMTAITPMTM
jgi:hypothetical protein